MTVFLQCVAGWLVLVGLCGALVVQSVLFTKHKRAKDADGSDESRGQATAAANDW